MNHRLAAILTWAVLLVAVVVADAEPSAPPSRTIVVHLVGGRMFTAELDARTNEADLWLQWRRGTISLGRPIRWDRVVRVELSGQTFSGEAVRQAVVALRRETPVTDAPKHEVISLVGVANVSGPAVGSQADAAEPTTSEIRIAAGARSLSIRAEVDNWDADATPDGLVVEVCPRDAEGRVAPVDGSLEVELFVPSPDHRSDAVLLERWTQRIDAGDFGPTGATCRLPFSRFDPQCDAATHGEVRARLMVPGEGVFEATSPMVRIRPYHVVRAAAR
jgi:hypothetical protein